MEKSKRRRQEAENQSKLIEEVQAITSLDKNDAYELLCRGNFDLERAIQLFMNECSRNDLTDSPTTRKPDEVKRARLLESPSSFSQNNLSLMSHWSLHSSLALDNLFTVPNRILCIRPFEEVIKEALDAKRWIMVNIQDPNDLFCLNLNRDLWANENVQDIIDVSFLFWQQPFSTQEGTKFCTHYHVHSYPYVAIIDPRTRGSFKTFTKLQLKVAEFQEQLCDFLTDLADPWSVRLGKISLPFHDSSESCYERKSSTPASHASSFSHSKATLIDLCDSEDEDFEESSSNSNSNSHSHSHSSCSINSSLSQSQSQSQKARLDNLCPVDQNPASILSELYEEDEITVINDRKKVDPQDIDLVEEIQHPTSAKESTPSFDPCPSDCLPASYFVKDFERRLSSGFLRDDFEEDEFATASTNSAATHNPSSAHTEAHGNETNSLCQKIQIRFPSGHKISVMVNSKISFLEAVREAILNNLPEQVKIFDLILSYPRTSLSNLVIQKALLNFTAAATATATATAAAAVTAVTPQNTDTRDPLDLGSFDSATSCDTSTSSSITEAFYDPMTFSIRPFLQKIVVEDVLGTKSHSLFVEYL